MDDRGTDPVFVGTTGEMEREHNETLNAARCRSHSAGTCPDCPENICPLCEGSGYCVVAAVDHPGVRATAGRSQEGVLHVDDREIQVPCVLCKASSGDRKRFHVGTEKLVRLYRPDGKAFSVFHVPAGQHYTMTFPTEYLLHRITVTEEGVG